MSSLPGRETTLICCSVLKAELEASGLGDQPGLQPVFLPSRLHMRPERLGTTLESLLDREVQRGRHVALVYGECSACMTSLEARPGVIRTPGANCCELLLGNAEYRRLLRDGAFFLLPEWAPRWREIFEQDLGLTAANATGLMQDMHRKLVYLDTGLRPIPKNELQQCAAYCGLPWEVRTVDLEVLRATLAQTLTQSSGPASRERGSP